jgi:hypothetical protein
VKTCILAIAMVSLAGLVSASPDELEDSRAKLKEAVAKKDADAVKAAAVETAKLAQAVINAPKPTEADEVETWQKRIEYGKEVMSSEVGYSLGITAAQVQDPAKTVELMDQFLALDPKSKWLDLGTGAYLAALGKTGGAAKQLDGMAKIVAGRPDNEIALTALAEGYSGKSADRSLGYANRLVAATRGNKRPESLSEADWEKAKNTFLATGYYYAGAANCTKSAWIDCDRDLKSALPLIQGDNSRLGYAYYLLGLANFQFGKMTQDRTKMQAGQKYSEQSAAIAGPYQANARQNANAMRTELAAPHR